ncbi:AAA family ATPase [Mesorhizobium sp. J428]|uniref:AAA family ATPase n=1 Tax=Mesorhizobium sp. J428 TaxID=2898440 RepID=UPI002150EB23|nr:ATP-binding protein [Mesorhizobium sp. J428]MCR5855961.1 ATP-binding protein [Mesorhizobium sp. J428]
MQQSQPGSKSGTLAPLKNVTTCLDVAFRIIDQPAGVDRLGMFFGPSGYGKSKASTYLQNKVRAAYFEVFDFWTRKVFVESLLIELGGKPRGTIAHMMMEILERLRDDPDRLIIIDEADKLVDKGMIELVRDVYKGAGVPVLLVGEEQLPQKLASYERCANRVTAYGMANPCDLEDAIVLARAYQPSIEIEEDLLRRILSATNGVASRIVASLNEVAQFARARRVSRVGLAGYDGTIFTGRAPSRRAA